MGINTVILLGLIGAALWTVLTRSLLRSAIGLAFTSVILAIAIFRLDAPLAAVFELSVCAGLISVLFVSTVSLTHPLSKEEIRRHVKERLHRFWFLPLLVVAVGVILSVAKLQFNLVLPAPEVERDVRVVLWHLREVDLIGQIIILLTGVFGVVVLFKERFKK